MKDTPQRLPEETPPASVLGRGTATSPNRPPLMINLVFPLVWSSLCANKHRTHAKDPRTRRQTSAAARNARNETCTQLARAGREVQGATNLELGELDENLARRVIHLEKVEDCGSVIGHCRVANGVDEHLVEADGS